MELSNAQHEAFAQHIVAGLSKTEAAKQAGYKPSAANNMGSRLAKYPTVAMRITELRDFHGKRALTAAGIRNPQSRVSALEDRWERMRRVISERAADPEMQDVPGGKTGLLCMTFKQLGSGLTATVVREYKVDTALLYELREHEQQAAEELGQWTTRKETYSQSVSTNTQILKAAELKSVIDGHMKSLPAAERQKLLTDSGIIDLEPEPESTSTVTGSE